MNDSTVEHESCTTVANTQTHLNDCHLFLAVLCQLLRGSDPERATWIIPDLRKETGYYMTASKKIAIPA
jgi:hypothetical protein